MPMSPRLKAARGRFGAAGLVPVVTIESAVMTDLDIAASASVTDETVLPAAIAWSSDVDGALGTGATLAATLSAGTHVITATADDGTNVATDSVTVEAVAP